MKKLIDFFKDEEGASAVEYGLLVALIAVFIIVALKLIGSSLDKVFNTVANELTSAS